MSDTTKPSDPVETTGHAWDGDLQEFNNPLPRWWLSAFYVTVIFAFIYWIFVPSWPVGSSWLRGLSTISYTTDEGQKKQVHWNTRTQLLHDLHDSIPAQRQQEFMEQVAASDFQTIRSDQDMLAFTRSVGKGLFGDNCAACHGRGGQGVMGLYPNLADDAWLWGGSMEKIEETLILGRKGYMPPYKETFSPEQLDDVAEYVLTLSGLVPTSDAAERGREIFQGHQGGCYHCHGVDGKGLPSQGSANLTDQIWTLANVPGAATLDVKKDAVKQLIWQGVYNIRNMPGWQNRLTPMEIKLLAVYVHQLGGGE